MRRAVAIVSLFAVWLVTAGAIVQSAPASASAAAFQYKDKFTSTGYNGNNGTDDFNGAWWEFLDWGGSKKGAVSVESGGACPAERCARISGKETTFWGTGLMRRANTADAEQATFRFKYRLDVREPTDGYFNVGVYDGIQWLVLDSVGLTDEADDRVHSMTYDVTGYADAFFAVGFFAHDDWDAELHIDNVEVFGTWDEPPGAPTTTTLLPTTTTTIPLPTTTTTITLPPTTITTTTTASPTTTTTTPPTTTTAAPTTTNPGTTSTTRPPATTVPPTTTTGAPPTTVVALPPATTVPPPSTQAPVQVALIDDERYTQKEALIRLALEDELMALPTARQERVSPSPVTQLMASITTTAVTVRSHLLSAMALGLLIAIAAIWGLGKREPTA